MSSSERSRVMARVRSRDTAPEMTVRRLLFAMGYRYRVHVRSLPGSPDIVFTARKKVIFIHGCFWHQHPGCAAARVPKSRRDFWTGKFDVNRARNKSVGAALGEAGWTALVVWECDLKDVGALTRRLRAFIGPCRR